LCILIGVFGLAGLPSLSAQSSPATLPDLQFSRGGRVSAIGIQDDGRIVISGYFLAVNGVGRTNIARINPNGSVDVTWNPSVLGGYVDQIAINGTNIFVAGTFTNIGGLDRKGLAKLSAVGSGEADPLWDPQPDFGNVSISYDVLVATESGVYVAAAYLKSIGGMSGNFAKLSVTGTGAAVPNWDPLPDGAVFDLVVDATNIYVGGTFTTIGGQARRHIGKLDATGSGAADPMWDPDPQGGFLGGSVYRMALSGTNLFVLGSFDSIGGQTRDGLAKLSTIGSGRADPLWNPGANGNITAMATDGTSLFVGGSFWDSLIGGRVRRYLAKVSATGTGEADPDWNPAIDRQVLALRIGESGLYVGGDFQTVNRSICLGLAKLDKVTGVRDDLYPVHAQVSGGVRAIALEADGKIIIGGDFSFAGGLLRPFLTRVDADGTLDAGWNPQPNGSVDHITVQGTNIFIAGEFTVVGGKDRKGLAKLSTFSDAADERWDPMPAGDGVAISALVADRTYLYVGGYFSRIGSSLITNLAKLNISGTGTADSTWRPAPSAPGGPANVRIRSLALDGTNLFVGGIFTSIGGQSRANLAKLSTGGTGAADDAWNPAPGAIVYSMALGGVDLFVAGNFQSIGGQNIKYVAKLNTQGTGAADPEWKPVSDHETVLNLVANETDVYLTGDFLLVGDNSWRSFAKLRTTGRGEADSLLDFCRTCGGTAALAGRNSDVYLALVGTFVGIGNETRSGLLLLASADAPVLIEGPNATVVVLRNALDGPEVTHVRITDVTGGTLYHNDEVTAIHAGDFITVAQGEAGLKFVVTAGTTGEKTVTAVSALNGTPAGAGTAATTIAFNNNPVPFFRFSQAYYRVRENGVLNNVTVKKVGSGAGTVSYATEDGTALTGRDYAARSGTLSFTITQTNKDLPPISMGNDFEFRGDRTFRIRLSAATGGVGIASPGVATVTIMDDDIIGLTESLTNSVLPSPPGPPPSQGILKVILEPADANGQWRLVGEPAWRDGGVALAGLATGNYPVEFKPVLGYKEPPPRTVSLASGEIRELTARYAVTATTERGDLRVVLKPDAVANATNATQRGNWKRQGEENWHDSGEVLSNLNAGVYALELRGVTGWAAPTNQLAFVRGNQLNEVTATYLFATAGSGAGPKVLTFNEATMLEPYLYNGQVQSEGRFGSGVVVKARVVLTAAHVVFDDVALSYVRDVAWLFQKYRGKFEPVPQTPRGWYVFEGYAARRELDNSPGLSSRESQSLDAAALFFVENSTDPNLPGRGGYAGYLVSDENNLYLLGSANKMLMGYPLDGVPEENRSQLHATLPSDVTFTPVYRGVYATTDIKSYPGNSGGPLFVQHDNGRYYPAGIYLGGLTETVVRAIDSDVVDLINRAEISGNAAGNYTGGGVGRWESGVTTSPFVPGLFQVNLLPGGAMGSGWRVKGAEDRSWVSDRNLYYPLIPGPFDIEFRPISGYSAPQLRRVEVVANQTTVIDALYTLISLSSPQRLADGSFQMTLGAGDARVYSIEASSDLVNWFEVLSLTNSSGSTVFSNAPVAGSERGFYRAKEQQN